MRVTVALVVGLLMAVPAMAQDSPMEVAQDPEGDNVVLIAGQAGPQSPRWSAVDLRSLTIDEDKNGLGFLLEVAGFGDGENLVIVDDARYLISFGIQDQDYAIVMYYQAEPRTAAAYVRLDDGTAFGQILDQVPVEVDAAAGTFEVRVPHELLYQRDGAPFLRGTPVTNFSVLADPQGDVFVQAYTLNNVRVEDRMPDQGVSDVVWPLVTGVEQRGHILLSSPTPVRVSNGEATTFVFEVNVANTADHPDTVILAVKDAPDFWAITVPNEHVRLDAGQQRRVPILITVPFHHQHGDLYDFKVEAQSRSDAQAVGALRLGVRYLQVPQPAGHHDTLWLHQESFYWFMNTLEGQPIPPEEDDGSGGGSSCGFSGPNGSGSSFRVDLRPGLAMGIDVDLDRQGVATVVVAAGDLPTSTVRIGGYFVVAPESAFSACLSQVPDGAIMEIEKSEPFSLEPNEQREIEMRIVGMPEGDYLPFKRGHQLRLLLGTFSAEGQVPVVDQFLPDPQIRPGSSFKLPLDEFHDDVDDIFGANSDVALRALDGQQRIVNPGKTIVFRVSLDNIGTQAADYRLRLTGQNVDWARLLGSQEIRVAGGDNRTLAMAVTAPAGSSAGEIADITLHVEDLTDPSIRTLIRLVAQVDTKTDVPDESHLAARLEGELKDKKSPAPWVVVPGALAVGWLGRRRT